MEYFVSQPLEIKKQVKGDECVTCAVASIGESVIGQLIDPLFTYEKLDDEFFGLIPEVVCQSVISDGFQLQAGGEPVKVFKEYKKVKTIPFFFNIFAGIKSVLLNKKKEVLAGCYWQPEWDKLPGGVIDSMYQNLKLFPHAFKVFGIVEKNGIMYLVIQNSQGKEVGDGGLFYFPESVAKHFQFAYYFN
jgi:hypothetical protein